MSPSQDRLSTIRPERVRKRRLVMTVILALVGCGLFGYGYFVHEVAGEVVDVSDDNSVDTAVDTPVDTPEPPPEDPDFDPDSLFGDDDEANENGQAPQGPPGADLFPDDDTPLPPWAPPDTPAPPVEPDTLDGGRRQGIREAILTEAITYGQYELTEDGLPRLLLGKAKAACPT